jgi:DnaK suppressor protein
MSTTLGDEIDVLAKAKRLTGGDYVPNDAEPYMCEAQQDYFRRLLLTWKKSIFEASADTLQQLQDGPIREPDLNDRASSETDWGIELSGEPIGLGRLSARPIATMTVEAQEAHERREKISRDN